MFGRLEATGGNIERLMKINSTICFAAKVFGLGESVMV